MYLFIYLIQEGADATHKNCYGRQIPDIDHPKSHAMTDRQRKHMMSCNEAFVAGNSLSLSLYMYIYIYIYIIYILSLSLYIYMYI